MLLSCLFDLILFVDALLCYCICSIRIPFAFHCDVMFQVCQASEELWRIQGLETFESRREFGRGSREKLRALGCYWRNGTPQAVTCSATRTRRSWIFSWLWYVEGLMMHCLVYLMPALHFGWLFITRTENFSSFPFAALHHSRLAPTPCGVARAIVVTHYRHVLTSTLPTPPTPPTLINPLSHCVGTIAFRLTKCSCFGRKKTHS